MPHMYRTGGSRRPVSTSVRLAGLTHANWVARNRRTRDEPRVPRGTRITRRRPGLTGMPSYDRPQRRPTLAGRPRTVRPIDTRPRRETRRAAETGTAARTPPAIAPQRGERAAERGRALLRAVLDGRRALAAVGVAAAAGLLAGGLSAAASGDGGRRQPAVGAAFGLSSYPAGSPTTALATTVRAPDFGNGFEAWCRGCPGTPNGAGSAVGDGGGAPAIGAPARALTPESGPAPGSSGSGAVQPPALSRSDAATVGEQSAPDSSASSTAATSPPAGTSEPPSPSASAPPSSSGASGTPPSTAPSSATPSPSTPETTQAPLPTTASSAPDGP
jgi:hypothetical protein